MIIQVFISFCTLIFKSKKLVLSFYVLFDCLHCQLVDTIGGGGVAGDAPFKVLQIGLTVLVKHIGANMVGHGTANYRLSALLR